MNELDNRYIDEVAPEFQNDNWAEKNIDKAIEDISKETSISESEIKQEAVKEVTAEMYVAEYKRLAKEGVFDAKTKAQRTQDKIAEYHAIIEDLVLKRGFTVPQLAKTFKEGLKLGALTLRLDFSEQSFRTYVQKNVKKAKNKSKK